VNAKEELMGKLDGKVAAITGAGGGIGRALAKAMAAQGASIVVNDLGVTLAGDRAPTSPANDVVAEIKAAGGQAVANLMDISTMEGGKGLVDQAVKEFGKLDILVNLAGVIRDRMIFNMEEEDWDRVLDSHLKGTFCTSRFASAHMRERRYGRIINFSSNAALGSPGQPSYTAAKAGILGLTFSTAQGLRRYGITCNAIFPVAATRMTDTIHQEAWRITPSSEARGTPADPANVAPIVIFLASDEAAEVTGQVFGSEGYSVTRYYHMSPERTVYNKGPWELDEFFKVMKRTLARDLRKPRMFQGPPGG
jgi:NAD(P)-dependent dehydrogenase (short-subunit alcohol dehydrogenase family)